MGAFIASQFVKLLIKGGYKIQGSKVLVLGITFKENCPDIRNSKVIDIITELKEFGCAVEVCDPLADAEEVRHEYGVDLTTCENFNTVQYDGMILAVAHDEFRAIDVPALKARNIVLYDVKSFFDKELVDERL